MRMAFKIDNYLTYVFSGQVFECSGESFWSDGLFGVVAHSAQIVGVMEEPLFNSPFLQSSNTPGSAALISTYSKT